MTARRTWAELKRSRPGSTARRSGYESARRAFELAERVRLLREAKGVTQEELARRMGTSQPAIARLEAGGVEPTLETLERLAGALGVELVIAFREPAEEWPVP